MWFFVLRFFLIKFPATLTRRKSPDFRRFSALQMSTGTALAFWGIHAMEYGGVRMSQAWQGGNWQPENRLEKFASLRSKKSNSNRLANRQSQPQSRIAK